uniref:Bridge-like lipid transfer protein family member 1 middle region domain-containing protein n=1 Tax=Timema shepardi TaxID=629360 RepID=A0A7R9APX4_TIMSH|nr:unnamed protein product [Timema shepardi]
MADMTVDDMIQKRNILYISRGQLKKHTSTIINVGLNVRYISQQVNMPLLRLLHQISNMYQNVKETQLELKEQQPEVKRENSANLDIGLNNGSSSSYMNLSEGVTTPTFAMSPSGSGLEHITMASEKSKEIPIEMPKCWKTVYFLLDLYAIKPETKTLSHRFSVAADTPNSINRKFEGSFNAGKGTTYGSNEDPARHTKLNTEKPIEVVALHGMMTRGSKQLSSTLQSLSITAALLPSLQAQYKMDQVNSTGMTGSKAKFTIDLPHHSLSFTTKLQVTEANLPSEASIELPQVHVSAEYIQDGSNSVEAQFAGM